MHPFHSTKQASSALTPPHRNFMGGGSWEIASAVKRLRVAAASCFFGEPKYYLVDAKDARPRRTPAALDAVTVAYLRDTLHALDPVEWRSLSPSGALEHAIDAALDEDPASTLALAAELRNDHHIRTTPQVILVRAARHPRVRGTGLVREHAPAIVRRPDEPAVGLAYQLHRFGKPVPNALKRAWASALARFDEAALAKYRLSNRGVSTVDVMNLVHPASPAVNALARGELSNQGRTWEAVVSKRGSNRTAWTRALEVMGHMALLRNLRNLLRAGIAPSRFLPRLEQGAARGEQLPFRYASAYFALEGDVPHADEVRATLSRCLDLAIGALPRLGGRVAALADNSGSAQGTTTSSMGTMKVSTIANLTGLLAGRLGDEGHLGQFGDELEWSRVHPHEPVLAQLANAEDRAHGIGQSTENGLWLFWEEALRTRARWDWVFVLSDMQAGHGGLYGREPQAYAEYAWRKSNCIDVAKLVKTYRERVNPHVRVFLVQVAGYQDTILPEVYDKTYVLGGWGEGIFRYAAEMARVA